MRISVIGLGYVGSVSAACLAARGHEVVGVDVNPVKAELVGSGQAPVVEERIGELTAEVVASGALRATTDIAEAIAATEVSLVCVGTPSAPSGRMSTDY
ncbi:MAG: GDP-mannose dehydrogenase, partial [Hamadaea sp.]|nr:GDP-mannose dehydrogenase [Hamadaea sp.]